MEIHLPEKRYYSIGEVAKAFGVNTSKIRFWEKGTRKFTPEDVKNLQLIYHLVDEQGFTLEGAKIKLKENNKKILSNIEIIEKLQKIKQTLISIKNEL